MGLFAGFLALPPPAHGAGWPTPERDPIPPEAIPESFSPEERSEQDSLEAFLRGLLSGPAIPTPPPDPSPHLITWLVQILCFASDEEIRGFAEGSDPKAWGGADPAGEVPLTLALALVESGRPDAADRWLGEGIFGETTLPYRELLRIEVKDRMGDSAAAAVLAAGLRERDPRAAWTLPAARRLLAALEEGGDPEALVRESLRMRETLGPGADELAARLRGLRAAGRLGEARAVGDSLLRSYPGTRTARAEVLRRVREDLRGTGAREGWVAFEVLMRHRLFAVADSLLPFAPRGDSLRVIWLEGLYQARRYDDVLANDLEPGKRWSIILRARHALVKARAARNKGDWDRMALWYGRAAALGPQTRQTAYVEWGREAESDCRESAADSIYTLLMGQPGMAEEGRFRRGISRVAAGRLDDALADFSVLTAGEFSTAAAFWRSRVLIGKGDSARATAALSVAAGGGGYYGRRARMEGGLAAAGVPSASFWEAQRERLFQRDSTFVRREPIHCDAEAESPAGYARRLRIFRRFGRTEWAEREKRLLEAELPATSREERFLCLGLPDLAIRAAIAKGSAPLVTRYPRPYPVWVRRGAERVGVSSDFVWAVGRRESLFDAGAVSGPGATGILQLMDATARETAARWGIALGPLQRADRNLELGIAHLRDLRDRNDWHLPALLAAYNAGESKASEWVARFKDPDLFVERIGWRETRDYVRHVLEAYWIYRETYESGAGGESGP